jgi:2-amino-4-hydroxy-6-hydroxymethyldihydropteridine diphosphokinase
MNAMKQQETKNAIAVALGSNSGDRLLYLNRAIHDIRSFASHIRYSSLYETRPVHSPSNALFLNAVISFNSNLPSVTLLKELLNIEDKNQRVRTLKNDARTLDLDLLIYGEEFIQTPFLTLPHPEMTHRLFVMLPLLEVWPSSALLPGTDTTLTECLSMARKSDHQSRPIRLKEPWPLP